MSEQARTGLQGRCFPAICMNDEGGAFAPGEVRSMKRGSVTGWAWIAALALLVGVPVALAEVDLAGFDGEVMRAMDDAFKDLEPVLGASNAEASREDVAILSDGYQFTLEFFRQDRGAPKAVEFTQAGLALLAGIDKAVATGDFTSAVAKARDLQANCKACHDLYRPKK